MSQAGKPKTNAEFRKLMMTPRVSSGDAGDESKSKVYQRLSRAANSRPRSKPNVTKKKKSGYKPREMDVTMGGKYRDRAKERRSGENRDYKEVEEEMASARFGEGAGAESLSIEDSKFLGGDIDHVHLVKGLDYTLLEQIKSEIRKEEEEKAREIQEEEENEEEQHRASSANEPEELTFKTKMGLAVYKTLFDANEEDAKLASRDAFLPGRMTLVFNVDFHDTAHLIPTVMMKSKEDCPQVAKFGEANVNQDISKNIAQIMEFLRSGRKAKEKRKRKKDHTASSSNLPGVSPVTQVEDNIFDDVGEYVLETKDGGASTIFDHEVKSGGAYFEGSAADDVPFLPQYDEEEEEEILEEEEGGADTIGPTMPSTNVGFSAYAEVEMYPDAEDVIMDDEMAPTGAPPPSDALPPPTPMPPTIPYPGAGGVPGMHAAHSLGQYPPATGASHPMGQYPPATGASHSMGQYPPAPSVPHPMIGHYSSMHAVAAGGQHPMGQYPPAPMHTPVAPHPMGQYPPPAVAAATTANSFSEQPQFDPSPVRKLLTRDTEAVKDAGVKVTVASGDLTHQQERDAGLATIFKRDANALKRRGKVDKREMDPSYVPDSYSEAYPGAFETTFYAYEEEEEDDLSKMDQGTRARKKIRRWDFESEAAWNKHKETEEATPKAAFQFGVKKQGGRRKSLKQKKKSQEAKFNREYSQISKILKEQGVIKDE